jgi:signal transduction histidine kinase
MAQNLCWGSELIQIYNDAYRTIMADKHPAGLGRSVLWSWSEIRDEVAPLFERVMGGETVYFEDQLFRVQRHGTLEDAYFTFSYSPVRVESGEVGGVLINSFETTQAMRARALQEDRNRLIEALQLERARLEYVFQQAPAFLAVLRGENHVFELVNDAYLQLVGHREVLNRPIREALPEVEDQGFVQLLDRVLSTGERYVGREVAVSLARSAGGPLEERFVDFVYLPLLEAGGRRSGIITHGTDVTESVLARQRIELLLAESEAARADAERARAEAETANRAKADFLASMSHELRTPLNAIGGYVDILEMGVHGPLTAQQEESLTRVGVNQRHLLTLIEDILSFAKLEAGQVEFELEPLDASALLASVEPLVSPLAEVKGIRLTVSADACHRLMGDEERVRQILLNLVGNAVKYTPDGGSVDLSCDAAPPWVHIRVRDDGPGIPRDKQQKIFEPFMQVGRQLSSPQEGVGLGLAISRDLARAMGGELTVDSTPHRGSTFTLRLPGAPD